MNRNFIAGMCLIYALIGTLVSWYIYSMRSEQLESDVEFIIATEPLEPMFEMEIDGETKVITMKLGEGVTIAEGAKAFFEYWECHYGPIKRVGKQ